MNKRVTKINNAIMLTVLLLAVWVVGWSIVLAMVEKKLVKQVLQSSSPLLHLHIHTKLSTQANLKRRVSRHRTSPLDLTRFQKRRIARVRAHQRWR